MVLTQPPSKHADDASVVSTKSTKSVQSTAKEVSNETNTKIKEVTNDFIKLGSIIFC